MRKPFFYLPQGEYLAVEKRGRATEVLLWVLEK